MKKTLRPEDKVHSIKDSLGDDALLPNCHSFGIKSECDVCIGYNDDDTHPDDVLMKVIIDYFTRIYLKVGVNKPDSNSITVDMTVKYMLDVRKILKTNN
jgi:hypothetical protein